MEIEQSIRVKKAHEYYLDRWLGLYEYDYYKQWLFNGVLKILTSHIHQGLILEIGCAKGFLSRVLNQNGFHAVGGDISLTAIKQAKINAAVIRFDGEYLPFKNESFNAVVAIHTLEHMPKPNVVISEVQRVLMAGGIFLAITPDKDSLFQKLGTKIMKYTSLKNPYHVGLMNKTTLKKYLDNANFNEYTILPFHNGFLGAPLINSTTYKFIPFPISTKIVFPESPHLIIISKK